MSFLLVILILTMQKTDILRQSFEGVFVGLGPCELAQVTIGLIRNRSRSCEEVGSGLDWLADKWPALPEQLLTLGTSPSPNSCPQDKDNDNDKRKKMDNQDNLYFVILGNPQPLALAPKSMETYARS